MAGKIPHAPSYREAVEAGLIQAADEKAAPAAAETAEEPVGNRDRR